MSTSKRGEDLDHSEINALVAERDNARASKNFARADEIRDLLDLRGVELEDTREGTRWKVKSETD